MRQLIPRNTFKSMIACKKSGAKNRREIHRIEYETDEIKSENKFSRSKPEYSVCF
jgi:hypothetical protein